ncbi:type II secretion system major pseudopilin GspG [Candidatus Desantisbacteria bacterium]|nr:type II secretion system major pseudopilin GspG [Candidatus Desantisbacteria bacterium]
MNKKGFTLIELMVVVLIISIIAALVGPTIFKKIGKSKRVAAKAQIELFGTALDSYRLDNDEYPSTEQGLVALIEKPSVSPIPKNWEGPYLKKEIPLDLWGNPYVYISPGKVNPTAYDLLSYGADGKDGGAEGTDAEDIVSWK